MSIVARQAYRKRSLLDTEVMLRDNHTSIDNISGSNLLLQKLKGLLPHVEKAYE